jgi:ABC-type multidrug transport system fused ATPase/permease subunit
LLLRFFDVTHGSITIDNINVKDFTKSQLSALTGVVPQEPVLFNDTIGYNIGYGKENATTSEIKKAARLANIDSFIEELPLKYETLVGERGVKLSGGQKQRLAIARMILSDPDIIIFDEATSQLDSESETLIQKAIWKVTKSKTTIIIAHRLSTAMKADIIVVLENGRIIESGSHSELISKKKSLYRHFWELQTNVD